MDFGKILDGLEWGTCRKCGYEHKLLNADRLCMDCEKKESTMPQFLPAANNTTFQLAGEGIYLARLVAVAEPVEREHKVYGKQIKTYLTWMLVQVLDGTDENEECIGFEVRDYVGYSMHVKSTLRHRVEAVLARELEEGETPAVSELVGGQAVITIAHRVNTQTGEINQYISAAAPYQKSKRKQTA